MTEVIWPLPSMVDAVMPAIEQALTNHALLSKRLQELTSPPPGSNTLYSLNARVYGRMKDIEIILARLIANNKLLTELDHQDKKLSPKKRIRYGKPPAKRLGLVRSKARAVNAQMTLDMESLFIFGNLLLEQWTYVIFLLVGEKDLKMCDFSKLVTTLQSKKDNGLLQPLWDHHHMDMVWLYFQLRSFRNMFIEHIKAPWQQGTSRLTYEYDFRLATPSPVGWIDENEIEKMIRKIAYLAPSWATVLRPVWNKHNIRQLLEIIFYHIDGIKERGEQNKVWEVWKKVGGWTPSYDKVAFRLMRFMAQSQLTMIEIITKHPDTIHLGLAPLSTSNK